VAILGAGAMGRRHARVFSQVDGFELTGVYDVHRDRAVAACPLAGARAFGREDEAIGAAELVVVATPISAHAAGARRALAAGCHVLVEKPLCGMRREALELCATAERFGAGLWVAHSERFNPVVVALRKRLAATPIAALELRRTAPPSRRVPHYGVLTDLGVHDLDLVAMLTGSPCSVVGVEGDRSSSGTLDSACVHLRASNGTTARVVASRAAVTRVRSLVVSTPDTTFRGDLLEPKLTRSCTGSDREESIALDATEPLVLQARDLLRALAGDDFTCATGLEGARAVALAEEAEKLSVARSSWYAQRYG
jgi:predicted dehydrogenase